MSEFVDSVVAPWAGFLADWSLRWGLAIAMTAVLLTLRPPRRAATRYTLCLAALAAGFLIPATPRWGRGFETRSRLADPPASDPTESMPATRDVAASAIATSPIVVASEASTRMPTIASRLSMGAGRAALLALGVLWAASTLAVGARLVAGLVMLSRLRRQAVAVVGPSLRLLDNCRAALALRRPSALAEHPAIASPVTVGGRRPGVLVPPGWDAWPEADRRACLLHELSHLARGDDRWKLLQELIRVPFSFHPLVRWLLARLDVERELLCDEAVVARGVDARAYARLLLDVSGRPGRIAPQGLPFLDRGTVASRIHRLLEDDMAKDVSPPSRKQTVAIGSLALAAALGLGGVRLRAVEADEPRPSPAPAAPRGRVVSGLVSDADGKPLADAHVVIGLNPPRVTERRVLKTGTDGRFSCPAPPGFIDARVYAWKEGYAALASVQVLTRGEESKAVDLKLSRPAPWTAILIDPEGWPIVAAEVRIETIATAPVIDENPGGTSSVTVGYEPIEWDIVRGTPLENVYRAKSDANGRVSFAAMRPGFGLKFTAIVPGRGTMRIDLDRVDGSPHLTNQGFAPSPEGPGGQVPLVPSARVEGRVVTRLPGVSVSGLEVALRGVNKVHVRPAGGLTKTDAEGQFAFEVDETTANIYLSMQSADGPWTYRAARDVALRYGRTAEVEIELIEGVMVEGRVVADGSGAPIADAEVGHQGPSNPRSGSAILSARTNQDGVYRFRTPPGDSSFYICKEPEGCVRLPGEGSAQTVAIPDGVDRFTVPPIRIAPAVALQGTVVDAEGRPVPRAVVVGVLWHGFDSFPMGIHPAGVADERGAFRLSKQNHQAPPGKEANVQVRLGDGREFNVQVTPAADGAVTIHLPEEATRGAAKVP